MLMVAVGSQVLFRCQRLRSAWERLKPLQPKGARSEFSLASLLFQLQLALIPFLIYQFHFKMQHKSMEGHFG